MFEGMIIVTPSHFKLFLKMDFEILYLPFFSPGLDLYVSKLGVSKIFLYNSPF